MTVAAEPPPVVTVPTLLYGGPRDGLTPGRIGAPGPASVEVPGGRYVRMDSIPGWMTSLPQRSLDTVIYIWEPLYVC